MLPNCVLIRIFNLLNREDINNISLVSKLFRSITREVLSRRSLLHYIIEQDDDLVINRLNEEESNSGYVLTKLIHYICLCSKVSLISKLFRILTNLSLDNKSVIEEQFYSNFRIMCIRSSFKEIIPVILEKFPKFRSYYGLISYYHINDLLIYEDNYKHYMAKLFILERYNEASLLAEKSEEMKLLFEEYKRCGIDSAHQDLKYDFYPYDNISI